jgi:hypothetical protein
MMRNGFNISEPEEHRRMLDVQSPPPAVAAAATPSGVIDSFYTRDSLRMPNLSSCDKKGRNAEVAHLIHAAVALPIRTDSVLVAVRVFDFALSVREGTYNPHLMAAACLLITAKTHDEPQYNLCSLVLQQFRGLDSDMIVKEEMELLGLIGYDAFFPASLHFVRLVLGDFEAAIREELLRLATVICTQAARRFECSVFTAAEVGGESVGIAKELIANGCKIDEVVASNRCRAEIVQALREGEHPQGVALPE